MHTVCHRYILWSVRVPAVLERHLSLDIANREIEILSRRCGKRVGIYLNQSDRLWLPGNRDLEVNVTERGGLFVVSPLDLWYRYDLSKYVIVA